MASLINTPTLFQRNPRSRKLTPEYIPLVLSQAHEWTAMEHMPGADVRVTVRSEKPVRLEIVQRPTEDQKAEGIEGVWWQDAPRDPQTPAYWLWSASDGTDYTGIPNGEWEATAVGPRIAGNPLNLTEHQLVFSGLFPWREQFPNVPIPPEFPRTPMEFEDLRYWLGTTESVFSPGAPLDGLVWWWHETPVAKVRARDFRNLQKPPNPEALEG